MKAPVLTTIVLVGCVAPPPADDCVCASSAEYLYYDEAGSRLDVDSVQEALNSLAEEWPTPPLSVFRAGPTGPATGPGVELAEMEAEQLCGGFGAIALWGECIFTPDGTEAPDNLPVLTSFGRTDPNRWRCVWRTDEATLPSGTYFAYAWCVHLLD